MAPIDPNSILEAIGPVISENGGILGINEVPYMTKLIKLFSEKLVSKCVYSNILLSTEETVLEEFLKQDGWQSIYLWLADAITKKDEEFLLLLLKVLDKCPITIERLRENNTPKILSKITKYENKELAELAKQLRKKWKEIVKLEETNSENDKSNKEKRKLKDTSNNNRDENLDTSTIKKAKTIDENVNLNSQKIKSTETVNNLTDNKLNDTKTNSKPVIKTAKCKLSKPRSIGVLEKAENSTIKPASTNHSAIHHHHHNTNVGGGFLTKSSMLLNPTASTPSLPLNKLNKLEDKGIKIIEAQPLPANELINQTSIHAAKHTIKESASFMDALNSVSKIKKKKKKDEKTEKLNPKKNVTTKEDNVDESMEIDDLNMTSNSTTDDSNNKINDSSVHSPTSAINQVNNEPEYLEFSNLKPFDPVKTPSKGILCQIPKKHNKRIFWPDDDKLESVKLFELDEGERCNVFKQNSFKEHRKEEMSKEREHVMKVKIPNAGITYIKNWELKEIDLEGVEVFQTGLNSIEKDIQSARLNGVLEDLDIGLRPEFPKEPDTILDHNQPPLEENITKNIPLVDENNLITDHSNEKYTVCDDQLNSYSSLNQSDINLSNSLLSSSFINQQFSQLPNYNSYNSEQNNLYQPQQQMYTSYPLMYQSHLQPQHQMTTDQKWTNSNWDSISLSNQNNNNNNNSNNYNHKNGNYNSKKSFNNNNKKDTFSGKLGICKFYQKSGKCKRGDKCAFKHTR